MLTILEGSTFCISDDRGDIAEETSGFFAHDTRFLSRLVLRVGGAVPPTRRTRRERKRVSCAKKPLVFAPMSPWSSEMQNVDPSRIVSTTTPRGVRSARRSTAAAP